MLKSLAFLVIAMQSISVFARPLHSLSGPPGYLDTTRVPLLIYNRIEAKRIAHYTQKPAMRSDADSNYAHAFFRRIPQTADFAGIMRVGNHPRRHAVV